jgi:hypothetical protein
MTETGTDIIRAALSAHMKKSLNIATVAKDLGSRPLGFSGSPKAV